MQIDATQNACRIPPDRRLYCKGQMYVAYNPKRPSCFYACSLAKPIFSAMLLPCVNSNK
ncbi:MAG: hypothetical protein JWM43_2433 [Acidobacteriaceae bacterium]|nr:hypothetical protein [Acidobacteriaceae bacterium]